MISKEIKFTYMGGEEMKKGDKVVIEATIVGVNGDMDMAMTYKDQVLVGADECFFWVPQSVIRFAPDSVQFQKPPVESVKWTNDWARFQATDENGSIWEYDIMPVIGLRRWCYLNGKAERVAEGGDATNWKESLVELYLDDSPLGVLAQKLGVTAEELRAAIESVRS